MDLEHIEVRRHRLPGLDVCDITMDELDYIEHVGSNVGIDFNVGLFSLGVSLSFLASLSNTTIESRRVFDTFVLLAIVGAALAVIFLLKWWRSRDEFSSLIQKIRDRQIGPTGDEGKELKPGDLEKLPPQEAGPQ